ncbi:MAG: decarboxylase [Planctomycetota bacterium]|nr:decarboxylase [Planctomycetota bacterium]
MNRYITRAREILATETPKLPKEQLERHVTSYLDRRDEFLSAAEQHGSPLYVLEPAVLRDRAGTFLRAFGAELPDIGVYYAVKSNNLPLVVRTFVEEGLGLDVSSGLELQLALECGAEEIIFSGPGKTNEELRLALEHADRVIVLMDSPGEMARLERLATDCDTSIRAGVRLTTDSRGLWRKFGIPPADLAKVLREAMRCSYVQFCGLQFHTSWNLTAVAQSRFIRDLGRVLRDLPSQTRSAIQFIDIGGGYWPAQGEWLRANGTPAGALRQMLSSESQDADMHYRLPAMRIEEFAAEIAEAIRVHLPEDLSCRICMEPGRWLCNDAMHLLMTVVDRKADDVVITDAGTNAVGWEMFETNYAPVINLTRPGMKKQRCDILGCLCTPHDVWGCDYWGRDIRTGDVLLIPEQGAYTYSLRQEFIKPLPKVVMLDEIAGVLRTIR